MEFKATNLLVVSNFVSTLKNSYRNVTEMFRVLFFLIKLV